MNINLLSLEVEAFFKQVDTRIATFCSTWRIGCPSGCGKCCEYPRVMASVLEFIPLANQLWDRGIAFETYKSISADSKICLFYAAPSVTVEKGRCTVYEHRGLICRTFGFMSFLKGDAEYGFLTCPIIKDEHARTIETFDQNALKNGPVLSPDTRHNFGAICPKLAKPLYPINMAMKMAIEVVFDSREKPQPSAPLPRAA